MLIAGCEPKFTCNTCHLPPRSLREGEIYSTMRCPECGALLYVVSAPFMFFWQADIPSGMTVSDFVRQRREEMAENTDRAMYAS